MRSYVVCIPSCLSLQHLNQDYDSAIMDVCTPNWLLQPCCKSDLRANFSHHLCETYSLNSTPNGRFLRSFSWLLLEIYWEEVAKYFDIFSFCYLTWGLNLGHTPNKPIHYQLDYGDFNTNQVCIYFCTIWCRKLLFQWLLYAISKFHFDNTNFNRTEQNYSVVLSKVAFLKHYPPSLWKTLMLF